MSRIPPDLLAWRRQTGADQWDEVWDGVLHMVPSPNREHQDIEGQLEAWLRWIWTPRCGGRVYHQINVARPGTWPKDYRIPDLVLLLPDRFDRDRNEYFEGGPNVCVEIHSPGDESYDKFAFYGAVGVQEVWIIHRDTRLPEIHRAHAGAFERVQAQADGFVHSHVTNVELRGADGALLVRLPTDPDSERRIVST
ncbi:MAG: Uma2 family endonuclease [Planctomycetes bacterium]|nr:Uma2 family endonuclease [Planctomycetota bacterium]